MHKPTSTSPYLAHHEAATTTTQSSATLATNTPALRSAPHHHAATSCTCSNTPHGEHSYTLRRPPPAPPQPSRGPHHPRNSQLHLFPPPPSPPSPAFPLRRRPRVRLCTHIRRQFLPTCSVLPALDSLPPPPNSSNSFYLFITFSQKPLNLNLYYST